MLAHHAPALSPYVDRVAVHGHDERGIRVERLADGRAHLVYRRLREGRGDLCVAGPRTRALFKVAPPTQLVVSLALRPGAAAALLGVPAPDLVDRIVLLDDVWSDGQRLCQRLLETTDPDATVRLIETALLARAPRALDPLAAHATALIRRHPNRAVSAVASDLGVSARHLRRVFTAHIGFGPKLYARMIRLQRAARTATRAPVDWAAVAAGHGYSDQAHLIADFRDLVGVTPTAYADRRLPPVPCPA